MSHEAKGMVWAACAMLCIAPAFAEEGAATPQLTAEQQAEMEAYAKAGAPGAPHLAMAATAGDYDLKVRSWYQPDGPAMEDAGTATRQMILDGRVLLETLNSSMMGVPFTGQSMTGYDNVTGEYWGTWLDSMSTGLMVSHGSCDATGACSFAGSWNDPVTKGPVSARMTSRWTSPTTQLFEMFGPGKDGREMKMVEILYTKK
ncbi:MAG: DUF1579 domain-containing protein [Steroidobacteraceae bacterium]|nr:DUF1579 domain-containing protein [Steroidobacteraceae bacterium]MCW5573529.1 DUF1579 domain-containing protein [Steroidobacteraceae bacterium]